MKVLHISTSDTGGAAIAAIRMHAGLLGINLESLFLTLYKSKSHVPYHFSYRGPNKNIKPEYPILTLKNVFIEKISRKYQKEIESYTTDKNQENELKTPKLINGVLTFGLFSSPNSIYDITTTKEYQEADIIHLHWISEFLDYQSFFRKNKKPIVWTLHDANPYRGGFHHEDDELRNEETHKIKDNEFKKIKRLAISHQDKMTIISPSKWLGEEALKSGVFENKKVINIANGIDLTIFKPRDKKFAKDFFSIPSDRPTFLVASHDLQDYRKGVDLLMPIMKSEQWKKATFIIVGSGSNLSQQDNVIVLGGVSDERLMALLYNASDYFLLTSRTDNLPNTMVEAIASGVPVIGFPIGDNSSILGESKCGFVCDSISTESLENTMKKALNTVVDRSLLRTYAGQHFDYMKQAELYKNEYIELYKSHEEKK